MKKRFLALILVLMTLLCSCDAVSSIAGNVLEAAKNELVNQIKATLNEYKVDVVEVKPLVGKLNDEGGEYQFFCAVLVKTNAESSAKDCANALDKIFGTAGFHVQNASTLESDLLVHKSITYAHSDYSEGNYYTVYAYTADISKIVDLDALADKLKK